MESNEGMDKWNDDRVHDPNAVKASVILEHRGSKLETKDWESVQFSRSVMPNSATPWTATCQASLSITNHQSMLKLMSIELVMPSNHLILRRPLLLPPSIFAIIRVFSNESVLLIRWPEYWSFSFSIRPSNEYSGLISFGWTGWISLLFKGLSRVFSNPTVQTYGLPLSSIHDYWKNHSFNYTDTCWQSNVSAV